MSIVSVGSVSLTDLNDVIASTTAPTNPQSGALWFNETDKKLYVYTNGQWLESLDIKIGGRNLLKLSGTPITSSVYNIQDYYLTETLAIDTEVTISLKGQLGVGKVSFGVYNSGGSVTLVTLYPVDRDTDGVYRKTFKWTIGASSNNYVRVYHMASGTVVNSTIEWIKLEKGNTSTDFSPAPEDIEGSVSDVVATLGNMANDNLIDFNERQVVKDKLTEIIGLIIADTVTIMPTTATLDSSAKGGFTSVRKSALGAGLLTTDVKYIDVATQYNALKTYLDALTPIKPWDLRIATQATNITVVKDTFRDKWMKYYLAVDTLAEATTEKLKQNVDDVQVGGRNFASNGDFTTSLTDDFPWKTYYLGDVKEIVDISADKPPFQFALHVKNTAKANGGIVSAPLFEGEVANAFVGKDVSVQFWLKYSAIVQGTNSWNDGRFGEIAIEGETSTGTKVYSYLAVLNEVVGTDTVWKQHSGTLRIVLPATAVKVTKITFKHLIEGATGEFWTTGIKVEAGNKVTDWSENPLDMQKRVSNAELKITKDAIIATVKSTQDWITLDASLTTTVGKVAIVVSEDNKIKGDAIASSIITTPSAISLVSQNIDLTGRVTFNSFDTSTQTQVTAGGTANTTLNGWKMAGKTTIDGANIETGTIIASKIKTGDLIVGTNVSMGSGAYLSWANITSKPTIPTSASQVGAISSTYIDANGVWTGSLNASKITSGTMSADRISGGTIIGTTISGATISGGTLNTDSSIYVGTNVYMSYGYAERFTEKGIIMYDGSGIGGSGSSYDTFIKGTYLKMDIVSNAININSKGNTDFNGGSVRFGISTPVNFNGGAVSFNNGVSVNFTGANVTGLSTTAKFG